MAKDRIKFTGGLPADDAPAPLDPPAVEEPLSGPKPGPSKMTGVNPDVAMLLDAGCWHEDVNGWHLSAPFTYVGPSGQWTAPSLGPMPLAEAVETEKKRPK